MSAVGERLTVCGGTERDLLDSSLNGTSVFSQESTAGWTHGLSISKRLSDTTWQPNVYNSIPSQKMTEYAPTGSHLHPENYDKCQI